MHHEYSVLQAYCEAHTSPVQALLTELERETHRRTMYPQMLSGPYQGMLLQLLSRMVRPQHLLEIGTFTGYGAICLAQGLIEGGVLDTIEINDELAPLARRYFRRAGLEASIRLHTGDAMDVLPTLDAVYDLVFLDAGKLQYQQHYELALPRLRPGGFLLADNLLWEGKALDPESADASAQALRAFADAVQRDARVDNLLLPVRDGLLIVCKK